MNRVVVACVGLLALAGGSAAAADLPRYYQPGPAYNPIYTWTGFYVDINATRPGLPGGSISNAGWTVGAGLEVGLVSNVSLKAEYLYVDLGNFNCGLNCGLVPGGNVSFTTNIFRGGANVRF